MCPHDQLLALLQISEPNVVFNKHIQTVDTTVVALAELVPQAVIQVAENDPACVTVILVPVLGVGLVFQVIVPPAHPLAVKVKLVAGGQRVVVPDGEMVGATGAILSVTVTLVVAVQPFAPVAFTT
jgi:hypothetical protein